jgi:hypothetical protein
MKRSIYKWRFLFIPLGIAAFLSVTSYVVMQLWNNLLPEILHAGVITFWQAMGIFILSKILFGFGGRGGKFGGGAPWAKGRMAEKFRNMTPEEREKFKQQMSERCGHRGRRWGGNEWKQETASPDTNSK